MTSDDLFTMLEQMCSAQRLPGAQPPPISQERTIELQRQMIGELIMRVDKLEKDKRAAGVLLGKVVEQLQSLTAAHNRLAREVYGPEAD